MARVVVAMSGGVDSSATAALLKEQGHDVVGVTLQLYDHGQAVCRPNSCCAGKDIHDARRVADMLGIPHYVIDFESKFFDDVISPFVQSYGRGETPVPCILCNQTVKFRDLLGIARDLDADALATGHYVRRVDGPDGPELWRGVDPARDQSYFLYSVTRTQLAQLWFPLGNFTSKAETRAIAARYGLPVAEKPDSQDICFIPDGDYAGLVRKLAPEVIRPGAIVDQTGTVLGQHHGVIHYTIGQRKGLGVGGGPPLYVLRLDPERAEVVVGPREALAEQTVFVRDINWLAASTVMDEVPVAARIRSTRHPVPGLLQRSSDGRGVVTLSRPEEGVSPGQACVFYDGDRVLGGGWITRQGA